MLRSMLSSLIQDGGGSGTAGFDPTMNLYLNLNAVALPTGVTLTRASAATDIVSGALIHYAIDAARISVANGLRVEGSRTNQARNNNAVATAGTLTGSQTDPSGNSLATLFTEDTNPSGHQVGYGNTISYVNGTTYTASAFFKAGTCDKVQILISSSVVTSGNAYANFDLTNGTVTATGASVSATRIQALSGGWYRCSITFTATGTASHTIAYSTLVTGLEVRAPSFTGTSRTYTFFGAQVEAGPFSSYIPTTTAAVTRSPDVVVGPVSWINETEGTICVSATSAVNDTTAATSPRLVCLRDSGGTVYHELRRLSADKAAQGSTKNAGVIQSTMGSAAATLWPDYTAASAAMTWKNNDQSFCYNNGTVITDTNTPDGMPTGLTNMDIGANSPTTGFFFGYIRGIRGWNRKLTNAELRSVTA